MPRRSNSRDRSRSRSTSKDHRGRRHQARSIDHDTKDDVERLNPTPSKILGVFGLSSRTEERILRRIFSKYGKIENINMVYDRGTGRSRGFGFIYYARLDDAKEAKKETHGMEIDGQRIRVDFSLTNKPHDRTPGIYMGAPEYQRYRNNHHSRRSRSRSPSRRRRSRSRS